MLYRGTFTLPRLNAHRVVLAAVALTTLVAAALATTLVVFSDQALPRTVRERLLAAAALVTVAQLLAAQREGEYAMLAARGVTRLQLVRMAALRILPAAGKAGDRLAARARRLTAAMASWQVSRQPLRQGDTVLLIVLAVATSTLALAQHQSWVRSNHDQATFTAGAGLRLAAGGRRLAWRAPRCCRLADALAGARWPDLDGRGRRPRQLRRLHRERPVSACSAGQARIFGRCHNRAGLPVGGRDHRLGGR